VNWNALVEAQNRKTYVLPAGWDSRDAIAEQLECSPDRVRVLLGPALRAKTVETSVFPVWDEVTKKVMRITAYRRRPTDAPKGSPSAVPCSSPSAGGKRNR
jgi:hypothetical protein